MRTGTGTGMTDRIAGAWRALWYGGAPIQGEMTPYSPRFDTPATDHVRGINPARMRAILDNADQGAVAEALTLFEQMERDDPNLRSVAETRRTALTGLEWQVISAADVQRKAIDKGLAEETRAYCEEMLDEIHGFTDGLEHLSHAIGCNLAVAEILWDARRPAALKPIGPQRLTVDPVTSPDVRIVTEQAPLGIVPPAGKFIVHIPHSSAGGTPPIARSLCRAQAIVWLIKTILVHDWSSFCELFGQPVRVGKYEPSTSEAEKTTLAAILRGMGSSAWAMVSKSVDIELKESSQRGTQPFAALMEWCDRAQSKLWLGGNLVSDTTGGTGTHAAAAVQDQVRDDLRDDDIRREARTVREQLLTPMVRYQFYNQPDAPVPYFERVRPETIDRIAEANLLTAAQHAGLSIGRDYAHERLGIPQPEASEPVLTPGGFEGM